MNKGVDPLISSLTLQFVYAGKYMFTESINLISQKIYIYIIIAYSGITCACINNVFLPFSWLVIGQGSYRVLYQGVDK